MSIRERTLMHSLSYERLTLGPMAGSLWRIIETMRPLALDTRQLFTDRLDRQTGRWMPVPYTPRALAKITTAPPLTLSRGYGSVLA